MALDTKDNRSKRQTYQESYGTLWTEMQSFQSYWTDLADYVKPTRRRRSVSDRNQGDRRNLKIIDSTATFALRTLQAGMHAGLTSPARPWFLLSVSDPDLAKFRPVKQWLHDVTQLMLGVMLKSNLYTALPTLYGDEGLFATGCMSVMEDERDTFRCYPFPIGTYALGLSERQTVDTFVREYTMSVRGIVRRFGINNVSKAVKTAWDKANYNDQIEVCWYIAPNVDADEYKMSAQHLPWTSCHFEKGGDDQKFLKESGFNEFPILAPRWEAASDDVFGTDSPGMVALGDIKGLQGMTRRKAKGVEKMIDPAVNAPTSMKSYGVNLLPGGVNFVDSLQGQEGGVRAVHETRLPIDEIRADIADVRFLIQKAFYEPLFLMLATADANDQGGQKTATEIRERHEEKLLALGPVVERNNDELHEPSIDRIFGMMNRAGMIPPAPPELEGQELRVEYLSIMSQAQKLIGASSLRNFAADTLPMIEVFPELRYKLKPFKIVSALADSYGIDPDLIEDDEQAFAALEQAQEAQAAQQRAEIAATMAKAGKDLGTTPIEENTALARVMERVGA